MAYQAGQQSGYSSQFTNPGNPGGYQGHYAGFPVAGNPDYTAQYRQDGSRYPAQYQSEHVTQGDALPPVMPISEVPHFDIQYLGASMLSAMATGLGTLQKPLKDLYCVYQKPSRSGPGGGNSAQAKTLNLNRLTVLCDGMVVNQLRKIAGGGGGAGGAAGRGGSEYEATGTHVFYDMPSIHFWGAVRFVAVREKDKKYKWAFEPLSLNGVDLVSGGPRTTDNIYTALDYKSEKHLTKISAHPALFAVVLRRTTGIKALDLHAFVCSSDQQAYALISLLQMAHQQFNEAEFRGAGLFGYNQYGGDDRLVKGAEGIVPMIDVDPRVNKPIDQVRGIFVQQNRNGETNFQPAARQPAMPNSGGYALTQGDLIGAPRPGAQEHLYANFVRDVDPRPQVLSAVNRSYTVYQTNSDVLQQSSGMGGTQGIPRTAPYQDWSEQRDVVAPMLPRETDRNIYGRLNNATTGIGITDGRNSTENYRVYENSATAGFNPVGQDDYKRQEYAFDRGFARPVAREDLNFERSGSFSNLGQPAGNQPVSSGRLYENLGSDNSGQNALVQPLYSGVVNKVQRGAVFSPQAGNDAVNQQQPPKRSTSPSYRRKLPAAESPEDYDLYRAAAASSGFVPKSQLQPPVAAERSRTPVRRGESSVDQSRSNQFSGSPAANGRGRPLSVAVPPTQQFRPYIPPVQPSQPIQPNRPLPVPAAAANNDEKPERGRKSLFGVFPREVASAAAAAAVAAGVRTDETPSRPREIFGHSSSGSSDKPIALVQPRKVQGVRVLPMVGGGGGGDSSTDIYSSKQAVFNGGKAETKIAAEDQYSQRHLSNESAPLYSIVNKNQPPQGFAPSAAPRNAFPATGKGVPIPTNNQNSSNNAGAEEVGGDVKDREIAAIFGNMTFDKSSTPQTATNFEASLGYLP